jgi:flagella basal body P-ring formation protein FlgA
MSRIRLGLLALLALAIAPAVATAAPTIKPMVSVAAPVVRLGDLFDGLDGHADLPVIAAPPPGKRLLLSAGWLAALAAAQHLDWHPTSGFDQVAVERASRTIEADEISRRLMASLAERAPTTNAELRLDNSNVHLLVAADQTAPPSVQDLRFDAGSGRFTALVTAPGDDGGTDRLRVSGLLVRRTEVPVAAHMISPGDVITRSDLTMMAIRADRMSQDVVAETADLVGKTPRRALRPGEPIRGADIEVPVVVHRGNLVTLVLETPNMRLTAEGKAMEDGGKGAVIRVTNTKSNRAIDAVVVGPGIVSVSLAAAPVTQ